MKKNGILHSELARIVAGMGHGDKLVICDSGYPIPHGAPVADIVLTVGIPGLIQTLNVVLQELHIEGVVVAEEMEQVSAPLYQKVKQAAGNTPVQKISHEEFKKMARKYHADCRRGILVTLHLFLPSTKGHSARSNNDHPSSLFANDRWDGTTDLHKSFAMTEGPQSTSRQ